jgi:ABC-type molybdate transport system permease subunit
VAYYILQIFETKLGQYSATITFASYIEDKTESLLDLCSPIA